MPVVNAEIAEILDRVADLLEIEGENPFRVRAYRYAARVVAELPASVAEVLDRGEPLTCLPGIGRDLASKIGEIVRTGGLTQLRELEERMPPGLADLLTVPGLGPKRVKLLQAELGVGSLEELRQAAEAGRIRALKGFGERTEQHVLDALARAGKKAIRFQRPLAEQVASALLAHLRRSPDIEEAEVAGSYRRGKETVADLDVLAVCRPGGEHAAMAHFLACDQVVRVLAGGETKSSVVLRSGLQVDLRAVPRESYGAALQYFTGSKAHNVALRKLALRAGLKVNEYGVFRGEERVAGATEEEVYARVGLPYIEPELREERGELEAARAGGLPGLLRLQDLRGDLHVHTKASDGRFRVDEMAEAARRRGYEYLAIADHSKRLTVARGLDEKRLAKQFEEIDRLNELHPEFRILKSSEVDIMEDGSLDLPDSILRELDLTVCSIHHAFGLPRDRQTERILRAMDNPHFDILGHPTGRLLGARAGYEIDLERVVDGAKERGCFLELNAQPDRLDLDDAGCRLAKERGGKVAISTDAHTLAQLDWMRFGVAQARRGWLEPEDVLNARSWPELRRLLRSR
ncbi:MAG: DNA polymerase/3'-5' exonuclease PolX [Deltaproteobacteria bacterium]|nr:DNA polymerase/3'-5' exonuclease PolX [Deltaproteobacteria bacterium]